MFVPPSGSDRAAWLKGPQFTCSVQPPKSAHPWCLILLGPPGVGKGTQSELLARHLHACHLSTGDVFRAAKHLDQCQATPAMVAALEAMRHGKLVSDDLVLAMVAERSGCLQCQGGFILDGFPRTVKQAVDFETLLTGLRVTLDAVISYELSLEATVQRSAGRLTCPRCHAVYHRASKPPKQKGICDVCGGELKQREDDRPEAVRTRLQEYSKLTEPLIAYYQQRGLLVPVSAGGTPDEIFQKTVELLQGRRNAARPTRTAIAAAKPNYT